MTIILLLKGNARTKVGLPNYPGIVLYAAAMEDEAVTQGPLSNRVKPPLTL